MNIKLLILFFSYKTVDNYHKLARSKQPSPINQKANKKKNHANK